MSYNADYQVMICLGCQYGLLPNATSIRQHSLNHQGPSFNFPSCLDVECLITSLILVEHETIQVPDPFTLPVKNLKVHSDGTYCHLCKILLHSERSIKQHKCLLTSSSSFLNTHLQYNVPYQHWWNVPNFSAIPKICWPVLEESENINRPATSNSALSNDLPVADVTNILLAQLESLDKNAAIKASEQLESSRFTTEASSVPLIMTNQGPFLLSMSWPIPALCGRQSHVLDASKFELFCSFTSVYNLSEAEKILEYLSAGWFAGSLSLIQSRIDVKSSLFLRELSEANTGGGFKRPFILVTGITQKRYGKIFSRLILFLTRVFLYCVEQRDYNIFKPMTLETELLQAVLKVLRTVNHLIQAKELTSVKAKQLYGKSWTSASCSDLQDICSSFNIIGKTLLGQNVFLSDHISPVVGFIQSLGLKPAEKGFCLPHEISSSLAGLQFVLRVLFMNHWMNELWKETNGTMDITIINFDNFYQSFKNAISQQMTGTATHGPYRYTARVLGSAIRLSSSEDPRVLTIYQEDGIWFRTIFYPFDGL